MSINDSDVNPGIDVNDDKSNDDEKEEDCNEADVNNNDATLDDEDGGIIMNNTPFEYD